MRHVLSMLQGLHLVDASFHHVLWKHWGMGFNGLGYVARLFFFGGVFFLRKFVFLPGNVEVLAQN